MFVHLRAAAAAVGRHAAMRSVRWMSIFCIGFALLGPVGPANAGGLALRQVRSSPRR